MQQSRTAFRSTSNAVEHGNAGTVEFGAADAEQDRTDLGHVRQPVLTGAGQCHGCHVYGRRDLKRWQHRFQNRLGGEGLGGDGCCLRRRRKGWRGDLGGAGW